MTMSGHLIGRSAEAGHPAVDTVVDMDDWQRRNQG